MYKRLLQELCHRRRWSLPKYSVMYDGPPHKPSYKASVLVNDLTFTSSNTFNTTKEAQNQAAMTAFLNLSSPSSGSSTSTDEYGSKEEVVAAKSQETPVIRTETARLSKHQLQIYARKNHLDQPVYTIKTEGLLHDIRFKATVVIGGKSFDSPTFFNTRKEAEQAAANVALMELPISADLFNKDESCPAKSLLLELTQREGFLKPIYKTTESRSSNISTFFSTVEVERVEFHGKASRSKKQAEHDAAKIAYNALIECGLHMHASFSSSTKENMAIRSTHESNILKSKKILKSEDELLDQEMLHNRSFPLPANKKIKINNMRPSSSHNKPPPVETSESNKAKTSNPNTSTYLLGNRFKVYTNFPNIIFPPWITLVPIGDDKWIATRLECPNDKEI